MQRDVCETYCKLPADLFPYKRNLKIIYGPGFEIWGIL